MVLVMVVVVLLLVAWLLLLLLSVMESQRLQKLMVAAFDNKGLMMSERVRPYKLGLLRPDTLLNVRFELLNEL